MKTRNEIEMDFSRAVSQSQELETMSKELEEIATERLSDVLRLLSRSWDGDNYELFSDEVSNLVDEVLRTADDLNKVSKNIMSTANIVYTAEKAALQLGM